MKKLIVFIYYLFILLNNTKINFFKSNFAFYLNLISISNKGLNTMINFKVTTTSRSIDYKNKIILDSYREYIKKTLVKYSK